MKAIVKRPSIVLLISAIFMVLLFNSGVAPHPAVAQTAPATESAAIPSTKPTVTAKIGDQEIPGADGSLCWPGADGQPACTMVDEPKLNPPTSVADGSTITFTVDPVSPPPEQLIAKLLDDPDTNGDPTQIDLMPTKGDFKIEGLKDGTHRIEVDVVYPADAAGNQPYVSYIYVIQLGSEATTEATGAATEAPTEAATQPATEAPTEVAPTQEGTIIPPTVEATTAVPPTATTAAPTAVIQTSTPTFTATTGPTDTGIPPTATGVVLTATTGAAQPVTPPTVSATVEGQAYTPIGITTCLSGQCQSAPLDANAPRISAAAGATAQFAFAGTRPDAVDMILLNADATTQVSKASVSPDNTQYTLPVNAGNYVLAVNLTLGNTTVTYYYRVSITS